MELVCIALYHLIKGLALRRWPILLTRSLRVQTGNILMFLTTCNRHKTYGKLSWSREVKRTTSLNHRHMNKLVNGVCSLTMTEASARAVQDNNLRCEYINLIIYQISRVQILVNARDLCNYRLIPSIQNIVSGWSQTKFSLSVGTHAWVQNCLSLYLRFYGKGKKVEPTRPINLQRFSIKLIVCPYDARIN